jgi:serine/threonine protein kinase/tetratricopeptide (TPR) repeat protein
MSCPDENTLVDWFERELDADARGHVERHLEDCDDCRRLVIELARTSGDAAVEAFVPSEANAPVRVGSRMGRNVVLEWLGSGGMGVVYAAFDPELDRRVAIKVLHDDGERGESSRDALRREAQALARVSHPHVLTVYDVGEHGGSLFLSMEYVRGETLAGWIESARPAWRVILARYVDAGRGLAAAHAAGLVHRDFKPSNVLLGADGRVRVTDFGLARAAVAEGDALPNLDARSWKGTPAYMSPEQRRGERVDARSDQYNFCVALHEALSGELPREGATECRAVGVPLHVRAAIVRGLSPRPADRFPTMDALVAVLARERVSPWRRAAISAVVALCGTLAVVAVVRAQKPAAGPCTGAERKLSGIWDADRERAIADAFMATKKPYAPDAWSEVERTLRAYATRWTAMHVEACEATRVHGEQSADLLDLRMACLDRDARDLKTLSDSFASADAKTVEIAVRAAHALPSIEACADATTLRARVRPPLDPAKRDEIARIRAELLPAITLDRRGQPREAVAALGPLLEAAKKTDYRALEAEIDVALGGARVRLGDMAGSDAALYDAVEAAEAGADDLVKATALVQLTYNLAHEESKFDEATRAGALAAAALTRAPEDPRLRSELELVLVAVEMGKGHYARGFERAELSRAIREKAFGADDFLVAMALEAGSVPLTALGDAARSLDYSRRSLAILERTLGPHHPMVAVALRNIGISENALHRYDDALRDARRARAIYAEAYGEDHPDIPGFGGLIGEILLDAGRPEEAKVEADAAMSLAERIHTPEIDFIDALNVQGAVDAKLRRFDEALTALLRAKALCEKLSEPTFETSTTLLLLGQTYLEMGRAESATGPLEKAFELRQKAGVEAPDLGENRMLLARALWDAGKDRPRALRLAAEAREALAMKPENAKDLAEAERWLADHAAPVRKR